MRFICLVRAVGLFILWGSLVNLKAAPAEIPVAEEILPQLKPILASAVVQSPQMILRNLDIAQADAARVQARAALLPALSGGFSYSINQSAVAQASSTSSRSDGLFYNFGLSQPLFHWGTLKAQADSGRIGLEIARRNYAEAYRALVVSLRAQFLGLIVKHQAVENSVFARKAAEANLAIAEEKQRIGQISAGEVTPLRLALDDAALAADRVEADYEQSKRYFCAMAGIPSLPDEQIPTEIPLGPDYYDPHRAGPFLSRFEQAGDAENTFQALNLKASIEQANLTYKMAKYRLFPKISLGAGFIQSNTTNVSGNSVVQSAVQSQSASVSAYWSIFDGLATGAAKRSALASKRSAERQLATYLATVSDQARDQEKAIGFAARAMRLSDTRRELMGAAVKGATEDLARGVGSQSALDNAQAGFRNSRLTATSYRAEYLNRWSEFASLTGIDPVLSNLPSSKTSHGRK